MKRLTFMELNSDYWMTAYHLAKAPHLGKSPRPGKVEHARQLLILQRFRDHAHHDQETP